MDHHPCSFFSMCPLNFSSFGVMVHKCLELVPLGQRYAVKLGFLKNETNKKSWFLVFAHFLNKYFHGSFQAIDMVLLSADLGRCDSRGLEQQLWHSPALGKHSGRLPSTVMEPH